MPFILFILAQLSQLDPLVQCWKEVVRVKTFVSFLVLGRRHPGFLHGAWSAVGSHRHFSSAWETVLFPVLQSSFYFATGLDFVKCFLCLSWGDHMAFVFYSSDMVYCINWFSEVKPTLYAGGKKSHLVMLCNSFYRLLDLACYFWRIFVSIFTKYTDLKFYFLVMPSSGFGIRVILPLYSELGNNPSSSIF